MKYIASLVLLLMVDAGKAERSTKKSNFEVGEHINDGMQVDDLKKYPFFVQVLTDQTLPLQRNKEVSQCGGTILSSVEVLTAAHCVFLSEKAGDAWIDPARVTVHTGDQSPFEVVDQETRQKHGVGYFYYYKKFNGFAESGYDIVILVLSSPVILDEFRHPLGACEGKVSKTIPKSLQLRAIGIGLTRSHPTHEMPLRLHQTNLTEVDISECWPRVNKFEPPREGIVCHNDMMTDSDTCYGDSGGPLFLVDKITDSAKCLYGVVSHGTDPECGNMFNPTVAARVSFYFPNFTSTIKKYEVTYEEFAEDSPEYPFYVQIIVFKSSSWKVTRCGGAILNNTNIITSAFCLEEAKIANLFHKGWVFPKQIQVLSGNFTSSSARPFPTSQTHSIADYKLLSAYNEKKIGFDLTLLTLKKPIVFDSHRKAIALCEDSSRDNNPSFRGRKLKLTGLRFSSQSSYKPFNDLEDLNMTEVSTMACERIMPREYATNSSEFCLKQPSTSDMCLGDRASPVFTMREDNPSEASCLVGLSSITTNRPCSHPEYLVSVSDAAFYLDLFSNPKTHQSEEQLHGAHR